MADVAQLHAKCGEQQIENDLLREGLAMQSADLAQHAEADATTKAKLSQFRVVADALLVAIGGASLHGVDQRSVVESLGELAELAYPDEGLEGDDRSTHEDDGQQVTTHGSSSSCFAGCSSA